MKNLDAVLTRGGSGLHKVVKVNVFLSSMDFYKAMNEVYASAFTQDPKPVSVPGRFIW